MLDRWPPLDCFVGPARQRDPANCSSPSRRSGVTRKHCEPNGVSLSDFDSSGSRRIAEASAWSISSAAATPFESAAATPTGNRHISRTKHFPIYSSVSTQCVENNNNSFLADAAIPTIAMRPTVYLAGDHFSRAKLSCTTRRAAAQNGELPECLERQSAFPTKRPEITRRRTRSRLHQARKRQRRLPPTTNRLPSYPYRRSSSRGQRRSTATIQSLARTPWTRALQKC